MEKIVFVDIPMYKKEPLNYFNTGNVKSSLDKEILYPINAILSEMIEEHDKLKVVLLKTVTGKKELDSQTKTNARIFEDELDEILRGKNVCVDYVHLASAFDESKENHEIRFRNMLSHLGCDYTLSSKKEDILSTSTFNIFFSNTQIISIVIHIKAY